MILNNNTPTSVAEVIVQAPIVYSTDSKHYFACTGNKVNVYNASTGVVVSQLCAGLGMNFEGVCVNPNNHLQIYSFTVDGFILLWDYQDAVLLKTYETQKCINNLFIWPVAEGFDFDLQGSNASERPDAYIVSNKPNVISPKSNNVEESKHGYIYSLTFPKTSGRVTQMKQRAKLAKGAKKSCMFKDGSTLALVSGKYILLWNTQTNKLRVIKHCRKITSIAAHPSSTYFATGDKNGVIKFWYLQQRSQPSSSHSKSSTEMHWHSSTVAALCFTNDGEYLLSGGAEAVLVIWQIHSGTKNFLPRLGAPINNIACSQNDLYYNLSHTDNSLRLVSSASLQVVKVIRGFTYAGTAMDNHNCNHKHAPVLCIHPRRNIILSSAMPGMLQLYDATREKHIDTLPIAPQMYISKMNRAATIYRPDVEHAIFNGDGSCLVTVDRCNNGRMGEEIKLKFWSFSTSLQKYVLSTCADAPHSKRITSVAYHPRKHLVVTTSHDKRFKVWIRSKSVSSSNQMNNINDKAGSGGASKSLVGSNSNKSIDDNSSGSSNVDENNESYYYWTCRSVGFYRDSIAKDSDFSHDGSLLAIAYGPTITLWDVEENVLKNSLCHVPSGKQIKHVRFIAKTPFLVACTDSILYVWNLMTRSLWWTCKMQVTRVVSDPKHSIFAVAANISSSSSSSNDDDDDEISNKNGGKAGLSQRIVIFSPHSPTPLDHTVLHKDSVASMSFSQHKHKSCSSSSSSRGGNGNGTSNDNNEERVVTDGANSNDKQATLFVVTHKKRSLFVLKHKITNDSSSSSISSLQDDKMSSNDTNKNDKKETYSSSKNAAAFSLYSNNGSGSRNLSSRDATEVTVDSKKGVTASALTTLNAPTHSLPALSDIYPTFVSTLLGHMTHSLKIKETNNNGSSSSNKRGIDANKTTKNNVDSSGYALSNNSGKRKEENNEEGGRVCADYKNAKDKDVHVGIMSTVLKLENYAFLFENETATCSSNGHSNGKAIVNGSSNNSGSDERGEDDVTEGFHTPQGTPMKGRAAAANGKTIRGNSNFHTPNGHVKKGAKSNRRKI